MRLLAMLAGLLLLCAAGPPPARLAALERGVNVTGWFRFAEGQSAAALGAYMSDDALAMLRRVGFTFIRLPFDPAFALRADRRAVLLAQVARAERAGLAVILVPASAQWRLENSENDRDALRAVWHALAPRLRTLDPALTFPELVNEPVFAGRAPDWQSLQAELLRIVRQALPDSTVIATGADWSSVAGLEALAPLRDPGVIYTFHFYDPAELTSLAAYRPGLDRDALARLPFPAADPAACRRQAAAADAETAALIGFVCAEGWTETRVAAQIGRAAAWARQHDTAVLAGEFGASARLNAPARLRWIAAVRRSCETAGIGWALWGYDDVMGFDLPRPPPPHPALDPTLLSVLGLRLR